MFAKVLVANRGEIALRIIRACRELGIATVAAYSTADAHSLPVRSADEAVRIGPSAARQSYLSIPNIIGAARKTGADAIHPGYGFLSEDPYFAEICQEHGITLIGPPPGVMDVLGDKASTRRVMRDAGLPLLPGTLSPVASAGEAERIAGEIGYPVIIKASAGGGGSGITVVRDPGSLPSALAETRATAQTLFKDPSVYLEKYLSPAHHVEIQVVCDSHGGAVHLGERDCSVQRRNQKLVEEAPSPRVDDDLRARMGRAAVDGAVAAGYQGVGTAEFLLDDDGEFWFMEVNPRIQVEHPVTELVTSLDLVREQIRIAAGERLSVHQQDVRMHGHAVECRVNAEDPDRGFAATPGTIEEYVVPGGPGVRVDSHCFPGCTVPPNYDSMIAKLLVWAEDRDRALDRMGRALDEYRVEGRGMATTIGFHREVVDHPVFRRGAACTDFVRQLRES
ncbi:acetyl-CoA carboxylase biotin carboxylase subunit [Saccharopolyspora erythraea]|uniref:acetyl-CoA carboxylase biotin carboxylase subunit n=1 Tax=Saccharopolyspora erythraea TaxID=1836 RepID=UPI001BADCEBF|nr:acetyl-CoA carboxylase biotin carboxylase subunit [Saccharopolyspora erythraea]QUH05676.1 acetyl-CoA carboxylase biotin carboxylase subunit [Saccharopolyspora erythraea]